MILKKSNQLYLCVDCSFSKRGQKRHVQISLSKVATTYGTARGIAFCCNLIRKVYDLASYFIEYIAI
jgi:hypothetical protein